MSTRQILGACILSIPVVTWLGFMVTKHGLGQVLMGLGAVLVFVCLSGFGIYLLVGEE